MLCRDVSSARGRADPTVEARFLAVSPASLPSPSYSEVFDGASGGLFTLTSSCNALILCQVFSLRPTEPSENSLRNKLLCSIASNTSPVISCSLKTSQCAFSTP